MSSSRPMSAGLQWFCRILGGLMILAALWRLGITLLALWTLAHSAGGLMAKSGQTLAINLAFLMGEALAMLIGAWLVQISLKKEPSESGSLVAQAMKVGMSPGVAAAAAMTAATAPVVVAKPVKRTAGKRWNSANVLMPGEDFRHVWGFNSSKGRLALNQQHTVPVAESLPARLVARDWKTLFQPKLNVAWLPVDQVFLRVVQLPVGDFEETLSMVELQLEKISPLTVTQVCWSIHILPHHVDNLQTIIVTIISRDIVEEYLGKLEGQGFLADRLELPMVDQLQATPITGDGAWVYTTSDTGKFTALVAWWYGGVLRNLALLHIPATENRNALFKEQLNQMAWAGELEGWLTSPPHWHLIADDAAAANWIPMFQGGVGQVPEVRPPLAESDLASLTANRAAMADPRSNLLPAEFSERYRQQFVDGLWMRGLAAVIVGYMLIVVIYMAVLGVQNYRTDQVEAEMRGLSRQYTNTLQLKAQLQILEDRKNLKVAALNTWKIVAENLPEGLTVQSLEFKNGKQFAIFGNAPSTADGLVNDFNEALRKAPMDGKPFFEKMELPLTHMNGNNLSWNFVGELARGEEEPK